MEQARLPFARKWRPNNLSAVAGQQATLTALENALQRQIVHHAYLFTGIRGIGKTSIARILAKCLNCEKEITATPCEVCDACLTIQKGEHIDVLEVDAASKTKIDDMREILDHIQYSPVKSRFKIYIIDEVHMLSKHSFNALLKTLEEPPSHVKFILATTESQKIPLTILSRCLQFHLQPFTKNEIADYLAKMLTQEAIPYEMPALERIAHYAEGSMRDALSLLEKVVATNKTQVAIEDVYTLLGVADPNILYRLLYATFEGKAQQILTLVQEMHQQGVDFPNALIELQSILHQVSLYQMLPDMVFGSEDEKKKIAFLGRKIESKIIQKYYDHFTKGRQDLQYAPDNKAGFEMIFFRLLEHPTIKPTAIVSPELSKTAAQNEKMPVEEKPAVTVSRVQGSQSSITKNTRIVDNWENVIKALSLTGMAKMLAEHSVMQACDLESGVIILVLEPMHGTLLTKKNETKLQHALREYFGKKIILNIRLESQEGQYSPAKKQETQQLKAQMDLEKQVENDPVIQSILQSFDAKIESMLVKDSD